MIERPNVQSLMDSGLAQWLEMQQSARDAAAAKSRSITLGTIGAALLAAALVLVVAGSIQFGLFAGAGIIALGQWWAHSVRKPVIAAIKQEMNARIAADLGCVFSAEAVPGAEFQTARDHDLLPSFDVDTYEDQWRGTVGDTPFLLYEAVLKEWRGTDKNRHLETVFRGALITIDFARRFHGVTLVERAGSHLTFFGMRDSITVNDVNLSRVKMVDPRFESDFTIWGSDAVEARYLVHPAYVERLIELERRFAGKKIRTLFHGGQLIIAVEADEDLFESGSLDAEQDRVRMEETIAQFVTLGSLATELNERPRG